MRRGTVDHYAVAKRGEELPQTKLTEEEVRAARRIYERKQKIMKRLNDLYSHEALAKRFRVATTTMTKVLTYETWKHVR